MSNFKGTGIRTFCHGTYNQKYEDEIIEFWSQLVMSVDHGEIMMCRYSVDVDDELVLIETPTQFMDVAWN